VELSKIGKEQADRRTANCPATFGEELLEPGDLEVLDGPPQLTIYKVLTIPH